MDLSPAWWFLAGFATGFLLAVIWARWTARMIRRQEALATLRRELEERGVLKPPESPPRRLNRTMHDDPLP